MTEKIHIELDGRKVNHAKRWLARTWETIEVLARADSGHVIIDKAGAVLMVDDRDSQKKEREQFLALIRDALSQDTNERRVREELQARFDRLAGDSA